MGSNIQMLVVADALPLRYRGSYNEAALLAVWLLETSFLRIPLCHRAISEQTYLEQSAYEQLRRRRRHAEVGAAK